MSHCPEEHNWCVDLLKQWWTLRLYNGMATSLRKVIHMSRFRLLVGYCKGWPLRCSLFKFHAFFFFLCCILFSVFELGRPNKQSLYIVQSWHTSCASDRLVLHKFQCTYILGTIIYASFSISITSTSINLEHSKARISTFDGMNEITIA